MTPKEIRIARTLDWQAALKEGRLVRSEGGTRITSYPSRDAALTAVVEGSEIVACPECGGFLEVLETTVEETYVRGGFAVRGQELPRRQRPALVAACSGCEYGKELGK